MRLPYETAGTIHAVKGECSYCTPIPLPRKSEMESVCSSISCLNLQGGLIHVKTRPSSLCKLNKPSLRERTSLSPQKHVIPFHVLIMHGCTADRPRLWCSSMKSRRAWRVWSWGHPACCLQPANSRAKCTDVAASNLPKGAARTNVSSLSFPISDSVE